jgi:D-alanine-D-alanine ligase
MRVRVLFVADDRFYNDSLAPFFREITGVSSLTALIVPPLPDLASLLRDDGGGDERTVLYVHVDDDELMRLIEGSGVPYIGPSLAFYRLTCSKHAMHAEFTRRGVPCPPTVLISDPGDLPSSLPFPAFCKLDAGYFSLGLHRDCIVPDRASLERAVSRLLSLGKGPVVAQPFLSGREFTVAVVNSRAFHPIERVLDPDEGAFLDGSVRNDRVLAVEGDAAEVELARAVADLALRASKALGCGPEMARVDLRMDSHGQIWVLEVNSIPSAYKNSYTEGSIKAGGSTIAKELQELLDC